MALASYPGFSMTTPPKDVQPFGVYWPALVSASAVEHRVVMPDGELIAIERAQPITRFAKLPAPAAPAGTRISCESRMLPLGVVCGARSGDKGGNANLGVWVESDDAYVWLEALLSVEKLKELLPEAHPLHVERFELPKIRALSFVLHGLLGDGVAASMRSDPQAKSLGEYLRAKIVSVPISLSRS